MQTQFKVLLLIDLSEAYCRSLMSGLAQYGSMNGQWIFCRMPLAFKEKYGIDEIIKWAKKWKADGIVALIQESEELHKLIKTKIPIIVQDSNERFLNIPNITGGYYKTGEMAADYFLKKGFKNFAFYGSKNIVWSRERKEGFENKLREYKINVHHYEIDTSNIESLWYYKPSPLSKWLKSLPKPLALFACDDNQGQHVTEACKTAEIFVPEEVAILGVDNDESICMLSNPPLSSIVLNIEKGGFQAGELLHKMMTGKKNNLHDIVVEATHIITRKSTDILAVNDRGVALALKYIHENFNRTFSVKDILKTVPLSRRALEKKFKKETGRTIHQEIQRVKIDEFCRRLIDSNRNILEICYEMGLDSNKNISRIFQKEKGMTPNQYRKKYTHK